VVIDAFSFLPKDLHFLIAGAGPELKALERRVAEKGLEDRVHFAGEILQQEVPQYLGAADIFVRASRSEGQGISFIEAMAAGLPTVGTEVGGIPDFLHEGETGFVAEVCDAKSVAGAILRALENPKTTAAIAASGRTLAESYDWDRIVLRMKEEVFQPLWQK
jgi:glycosyltransferase involved in cell wall biosynthesis